MNWLGIFGDALWIIALSMMAGGAREAWRRLDAETRVPMQFSREGKPVWRLKRNVALLSVPLFALAVGLFLGAQSRSLPAGPDMLVLFGVRATLAAVFTLVHMRWLSAAMAQLSEEGALRS